jgi:hypothetical protein
MENGSDRREQMRAFLEASEEVGFKASDQKEVYGYSAEPLRSAPEESWIDCPPARL